MTGTVTQALLSVSDKTGIVDFARALVARGIRLLSTGGTARLLAEHHIAATDVATYTRERPGMSAFVREDGAVYHVYSAYARGLDGLWGMYQWLDRAPNGRNEQDGIWWRRNDEYEER